jgi:hypothetical protein
MWKRSWSVGVGHDVAGPSGRLGQRRVFERLKTEALAAYDRIIGLDLSEVALDGSLHKAPCGGEGIGANPTDRAKLGWKWSLAVDARGIPLGWAIDGANRNDRKLLEPTLHAVASVGLLAEIDTMYLDRGYEYPKVRAQLAALGPEGLDIQRRGQPGGEQARPPLTRASLAGRRNELVAVELRTAPAQHRPARHAPPRPTLPRHRRAHRGQTHRLAQPWEPYPRNP